MNLFELAATLMLDSSDYDKGIDEAQGKAASFGSKVKSGFSSAAKVGAAAIGAASAAAVAFAKSSVDAGMTFDSSMSQVAATMGTTVDEIQDLRDFAQEMGSKTAFSASQAADALNYMALAGYDAETSMEMLPNVLNLAAAGGIDLAYASDMITDSQSALGLSLDETAELVDKMAKASSKSNTSVAQLGEAILTVGGTAKTLAGGTTELSTALGILADNGVKGAEGGTALRNIILSLSAPTSTAAEAMESLGLNAFDADGNLRPLNETFGDLDKALSTMTQGEQTQVLNQIFNKVDLKSVNALLANTNERFDELSGYIDDASGAAQAMADTQLDNLAGDITLFQSALEGAQIVLSDQLTPTLREFVQFGAQGLSEVTEAFKEGGLSGAMDSLGGILGNGIVMITDMLPNIIDAGIGLIDSLIDGIIQNLPAITDAALKIALMLIDGIGTMLPKLVTAGLNIIKSLAKGIADNIKTIVETVVDVVLAIVEELTNPDTLLELLDAGLQIILGLVDGLIAAIPKIIEALPIIIQNIINALLGSIPMIIEAGITLLTSLVGALPDIIAAIVAVIPQILSGIISALISNIPLIIQAGIDLLISLVQNLPVIITEIVKAIPQIISGIVDGIFGNLDKIIMAGVDLFIALIENLPMIIIEIVKAVPQIISGLVEAFSEHGADIIDAGKNLITGLWEGIQKMGDWIKDKVSGFFGGIVDGVKDLLGIHSPSTVFADMGKNMALGMGEGFDDEFSDIRKDIDDQLDFTATANVDVNRSKSSANGYASGHAGAASYSAGQTEKQPLVVILQLPSGVEVGRQYIEDINLAKRVDGLIY